MSRVADGNGIKTLKVLVVNLSVLASKRRSYVIGPFQYIYFSIQKCFKKLFMIQGHNAIVHRNTIPYRLLFYG